MGLPGAGGDFQIRKHRCKTGILRAAGVNTEANPARPFPHVADAHLGKVLAVLRTLDAVVILAPAMAVVAQSE